MSKLILPNQSTPHITVNDKPMLLKDLPFVEEQDFGAETTLIKNVSEFNAPMKGSKTLIIPVAHISLYQKKVKDNPDYFKNDGIRFLKVLKDEDFARFMNIKLQYQGAGRLPDSEIISNAGISIHQNLQTF